MTNHKSNEISHNAGKTEEKNVAISNDVVEQPADDEVTESTSDDEEEKMSMCNNDNEQPAAEEPIRSSSHENYMETSIKFYDSEQPRGSGPAIPAPLVRLIFKLIKAAHDGTLFLRSVSGPSTGDNMDTDSPLERIRSSSPDPNAPIESGMIWAAYEIDFDNKRRAFMPVFKIFDHYLHEYVRPKDVQHCIASKKRHLSFITGFIMVRKAVKCEHLENPAVYESKWRPYKYGRFTAYVQIDDQHSQNAYLPVNFTDENVASIQTPTVNSLASENEKAYAELMAAADSFCPPRSLPIVRPVWTAASNKYLPGKAFTSQHGSAIQPFDPEDMPSNPVPDEMFRTGEHNSAVEPIDPEDAAMSSSPISEEMFRADEHNYAAEPVYPEDAAVTSNFVPDGTFHTYEYISVVKPLLTKTEKAYLAMSAATDSFDINHRPMYKPIYAHDIKPFDPKYSYPTPDDMLHVYESTMTKAYSLAEPGDSVIDPQLLAMEGEAIPDSLIDPQLLAMDRKVIPDSLIDPQLLALDGKAIPDNVTDPKLLAMDEKALSFEQRLLRAELADRREDGGLLRLRPGEDEYVLPEALREPPPNQPNKGASKGSTENTKNTAKGSAKKVMTRHPTAPVDININLWKPNPKGILIKKCSNCYRSGDIDKFTGVKGNETAQCIFCRDAVRRSNAKRTRRSGAA